MDQGLPGRNGFQWVYWLRWLAVLPVALAAIPVTWFAVSAVSSGVLALCAARGGACASHDHDWSLLFIMLAPVFFVTFGVLAAPARRAAVAWGLLALGGGLAFRLVGWSPVFWIACGCGLAAAAFWQWR